MLEGILITLTVFGFVTFFLAIERHSVIYSLIDIFIWLIVAANALNIETETATFTDHSLSAFAIIFVMVNLIWSVVKVFDLYLIHKRIKM